MGKEIERKYLLFENGKDYSTDAIKVLWSGINELIADVNSNGVLIKQGYIPRELWNEVLEAASVQVNFKINEVRLRKYGDSFYLTIKSKGTLERGEIEKTVNKDLFNSYWHRTERMRILKKRLKKSYGNHTLEIDVYRDRDLVIAEVELKKTDAKITPVGLDITDADKYKNRRLAR